MRNEDSCFDLVAEWVDEQPAAPEEPRSKRHKGPIGIAMRCCPECGAVPDGGPCLNPERGACLLHLEPPDTNPMRDLLEEAIATVAARGKPYGGVEDNFGRIARRWSVHLLNRYGVDLKLDEADVAVMMIDMKQSRLENDHQHRDSWVDIAGYAACGGSLSKKAVDSA